MSQEKFPGFLILLHEEILSAYFPVVLLIEEFTLTVASWVIRERWREIRRSVLEFKAS